MDSAEQEQAVKELDERVERLRAYYDQYFMGIERTEPLDRRKDVDKRILLLRRENIRNTGLRFKSQQIIQRYNSFAQYWHRILREIENGTYKRDVLRAKKRFGSDVPAAARKGAIQLDEADAGDLDFDIDLHHEEDEPADAPLTADAALEEDLHQAFAPARPARPGPPPAPQRAVPAAPALEEPFDPPTMPAMPAMPVNRDTARMPVASPIERGRVPSLAPDMPSAPRMEAAAAAPRPGATPAQPPPARVPGAPPARPPQAPGSLLMGAKPPQAAGQVPPMRPATTPTGPGTGAQPPAGSTTGAPAPSAPRLGTAQPAAASQTTRAPAPVMTARPAATPTTNTPAPRAPTASALGPRTTPAPATTRPATSNADLDAMLDDAFDSMPKMPVARPAAPAAKAAPPAAAPSPAPTPRPAPTAAPTPRPAATTPAPARPPAASPAPMARPAAPSPASTPRPAPATAASSGDDFRQVYQRYVEARRSNGESTAGLTYEGLAKNLRETSAKLRDKSGGRAIDFDVVVKDGKAVLKPVVK